jgi:hypothetical protein
MKRESSFATMYFNQQSMEFMEIKRRTEVTAIALLRQIRQVCQIKAICTVE